MSELSITGHAYALNSPQAAGRVVALALIANGEIKPSEWTVLHELQACAQLGLSPHEWHEIVDGLCQDLLANACAAGDCVIDQRTLAHWLAEVDDPDLQQRVIQLCAHVIAADGYVEPGEGIVLRSALQQWVLPMDEQARMEPMLYGLDFQVMPRKNLAAADTTRSLRV